MKAWYQSKFAFQGLSLCSYLAVGSLPLSTCLFMLKIFAIKLSHSFICIFQMPKCHSEV